MENRTDINQLDQMRGLLIQLMIEKSRGRVGRNCFCLHHLTDYGRFIHLVKETIANKDTATLVTAAVLSELEADKVKHVN